MPIDAAGWLSRIRSLPLTERVRIMNVCGGHERTISMAGIRSLLPDNVELIPGPGCPVCVCPEEDVYEAIQLALNEDITLLAFGDMLRVPVNAPKSEPRSLEQARARGADVRPIASPLDAVKFAKDNPQRRIIFFATGFETTTAPVAAMLAQGVPDNLLVLLSGRLTWPAVAMLLDSGDAGFNCLIAPGHVSAVMGMNEWDFVPEKHHISTAVAGFEPATLLAAIYSTLRQYLEGNCFLDNCYPDVVRPEGNSSAQHHLEQTMNIADANWRGVGVIPDSGYKLKSDYAAHDARKQLPDYSDSSRKRCGEMPPGCACADVVLGKCYPNECILYGKACTPRKPIGPCMVSDEGACRIWWASGIREQHNAA